MILLNKIFHPNVSDNGTVCLKILRMGWSPVMDLLTLMFNIKDNLEFPDCSDPLNLEAAAMLKNSPALYLQTANERFK